MMNLCYVVGTQEGSGLNGDGAGGIHYFGEVHALLGIEESGEEILSSWTDWIKCYCFLILSLVDYSFY